MVMIIRKKDSTHLSYLRPLADLAADTDDSALPDDGAPGLDDSVDLDRGIVVDHDAAARARTSAAVTAAAQRVDGWDGRRGRVRVRVRGGRHRRGGADDGALVDDAAAADGYTAVGGVEARAGVHDRLGADVDGVVARQQRRVGDDDGRGEVDGRLGARGRAAREDRLPLAAAGRHI